MKQQPLDTTIKVVGTTLAAYESGKKMMINQGGQGSRKTYGSLEALLYIFLTNPGKNWLASVVSETMPHIRRGAMRDFENLLKIYNLWDYVYQQKTVHSYTLCGNRLEFFGADMEDKVRGPRREFLFLNEVYNIPFGTFVTLTERTNLFTICDFNPVSEFYIHNEVLANPDVFECDFSISTYLDNPYLPEGERKKIEAKKSLAGKSEYWANWWRVYGQGQLGHLQGLIYDDWEQIDEMPTTGGIVSFGMDFGYSSSATVLLKLIVIDDRIYIDEIIYEKGLLNKNIITLLERRGIKKNYDEIYADRARPDIIEEIHQAGYNIKPYRKHDKLHVIHKIKEYKTFVTKRSVNTIREMRNFAWLTDKHGKATNKPSDNEDHAMDAFVYGMTKIFYPPTVNWSL